MHSCLNTLRTILFQHLQNVTHTISKKALESIQDDSTYERNRTLFQEWRITEIVNLLRYIRTMDSIGMKNEINRELLKTETSYGYMIMGCLERYRYHPITALRHFRQSLHLNPSNYETRMYIANTLDSDVLNMRLECSKQLQICVHVCQNLIDIITYCLKQLDIDPKMLTKTMNDHHCFLYLIKYV